MPLACQMANDVWDDDSWYALSTRLIELAREAGALAVLPVALLLGMTIQLLAGEFAMADSMALRGRGSRRATSNPVGPVRPLAARGLAWPGSRSRSADRGRQRRDGGARRGTVADRRLLGDGDAQQRLGPLRRGAGRGRKGQRIPRRAGVGQLVDGRADRGSRPDRAARAGRQCPAALVEDNAMPLAPTGR